jgi:RNA polymerase sigma factor (sigma-70 family)
MTGAHGSSGFHSTIWTQVVLAGKPDSPEACHALATLCRGYWNPIHALIRRRWHPADEADDLTQEYFERLMEKETLARADRERGRFRDFLRKVCKNFLRDERRRRQAAKNGGGVGVVPIDAADGEGRPICEPADTMTPDRDFDQDCALALVRKAVDRLAREYADRGRAEVFEHLKFVLTEGRGAVPAAALAARLGMTEGHVNTQASRLRARYREILMEEIAATLFDPSRVDEEMRSLFDALRS